MSEKNIYQVLAEAQSELPVIPKNGKNPHFKSDFATLDDIIKSITPILSKYGLAVTHTIQSGLLATRLHYGEESIISEIDINPFMQGSGNQLHKLGQMFSYVKRYNLAAMLNLALGDDNDAGGENDFNQSENIPQPEKPWLNFPRGSNKNEMMGEIFYDPIIKNGLDMNNIVQFFSQTYKISNQVKEYLLNNAIYDAQQWNYQIEQQLDHQTMQQDI